jgi:predicted  nucleic acid-binding Zn-ribbon protein
LTKKLNAAELSLQECRNQIYTNDVQHIYRKLQEQLDSIDDDISELNISVEFVEKEYERIRLGLTSEEVRKRREFITKVQSACRILKRHYETIKQKNKVRIGSSIYDPLGSSDIDQDNQTFMNEQHNIQVRQLRIDSTSHLIFI